jgi:hypothetical protein
MEKILMMTKNTCRRTIARPVNENFNENIMYFYTSEEFGT